MKVYEQTTYETCLACSLLMNLKSHKKITRAEEMAVLEHSLNFSKRNFTLGHLDYIAGKNKIKIHWHVDNQHLCILSRKMNLQKNILVWRDKISLNLVDDLLKNGPIVLYVDSYFLDKDHHYPHFITVIKKEKGMYKILDTWDGKEKSIKSGIISKSIISLRNRLRFCPQAIQFEKL